LQQGNRQSRLSDHDLNVAALPIPMAFGMCCRTPSTTPASPITSGPNSLPIPGRRRFFLALYAVRRRSKDTRVRLWGGVALIFFLLSFGLQNPLYRVVLEIFPPYTLVRNPARHLAVVQLALALLAAIGLDTLLDKPLPAWNPRRMRWQIAGIALAVGIMILAGTRTLEAEKSWDVLPERFLRGIVWFVAALAAFLLSVNSHGRSKYTRSQGAASSAPTRLRVILIDLVLYAFPLYNGERTPGHLDYLTARSSRSVLYGRV